MSAQQNNVEIFLRFWKHMRISTISFLIACMMISSIFMLACQPRVPSLPQIDSVQPATVDQATKIGSTVAPAKRSDVTVIEVWIGTDSGRKWAEFRELGAGFMEKYPKIEIRFVPIAEGELTKRMETAQAANVLPDIVWGGAERVFSFAADDIVDEYAVEEVINNVGTADFKERILNLLANADTGRHIAIPFYGWVQAIWYRQDLFEKAGLAAPTNWEAIIAACEVLPNTNGIEYGITLGTDPTQNYPHQFFEQVAMSNDAWPFSEDGTVTMDTPQMVEALRFYTSLQKYAPQGPQYWRGARESYELGQSAMLLYSTFIMDDLVDGSDLASGDKVQIAVPDLARKTGMATVLEGPNGSAIYGQVVVATILKGADSAAQQVIEYFLTEGFVEVISIEPHAKIPVLKSRSDEWSSLSEYFSYYSQATIQNIASSMQHAKRWIAHPEYNDIQRAVVGDIEGKLLISQAISEITLSNTMTPESAAIWLQEQVKLLYAKRQ